MTLAHKPVPVITFGGRLFAAWYLFQARTGGPRSQEWLAAEVSSELKLERPLTQGSVSRWLRDDTEPDLTTIAALARVLGVDPGWLAFGSDSQAPPPQDPMQEGMRRIILPEPEKEG